MLSIYFEDKVINFANSAPADADLLSTPPDDVAKVLQKLEIIKAGWVVSPRYRELFDDFSRLFEVRAAAGGVVADRTGDVLLILRNGRWDLPKGHMEKGEEPDQCAVREVCEECGVQAAAGTELCVTYHAYELQGRWILKRCHWFVMSCGERYTPVPQREEGIERAQWTGRGELRRLLQDSFGTIKHVINTYLNET